MLVTVKAAAGRGWGRVRTQAQPVEPRALRQPTWGDAHLRPSVCSQKSETLRAYTTLWPKGPRTGATAGQHNGSGSRSRPKGGGEAFSLKKKSLAKAQNASATGTWARGCGPVTCGWRGDPGSNCGSCSTLRIPLLSPSSVKGPRGGEGPKHPREPTRAIHSPRLDLKALRHLASLRPPDSKLRVFRTPASMASPGDRRQDGPMAGRKASTLCSPATLSQWAPVSPKSRLPCRAPPTGHTRSDAVCRHLVCGKGRVSEPVYGHSRLSSHRTNFLVRQPTAMAIKTGRPSVLKLFV